VNPNSRRLAAVGKIVRGQEEDKVPVSPFRNYGPVVPGRCRPFGRCVVCRGGPTLVCHVFTEMVAQSWSKAEIDILTKAARAALL
jgi:hypothetical protein